MSFLLLQESAKRPESLGPPERHHISHSAYDVNNATARYGALFSVHLKQLYTVPRVSKHGLWRHTGLCLSYSSATF